MSHRNEKEIEMVDTINGNTILSRRHTHAHLHLNPTVVLDHIKTKVKRKRNANIDLQEVPAFATNGNSNGNNIPKRSNQEPNELDLRKPLVATSSQPIVSTRHSSDQGSIGSHENKTNEENNLSIEKDEQNDIVPDLIKKDEEITEIVQLKSNLLESDIDNTSKNSKSKLKLTKLSKSLSDSHNPINIKKRRQTIRRTVQCSSKIQLNKITKRNDLDNMEPLPHSAGFQIRDEDFNNIFQDLPSDEQLIVAYPCAWRKDIFLHGRMFLSVNYLCFYTCFFKWEESLCIAYKDIISIVREKSAKVLPNAIQLRTKNREQYIFASYIPRERIYITVFRLWQNALLDKPLEYQQLRAIVYADQMSLDESTGDSEGSVVQENNGEQSPDQSVRSLSLPQSSLSYLKEASSVIVPSNEGITLTAAADKEPTTSASTDPCKSHLARIYGDRILFYQVDQLFDLIFGDNSFTRAFHDSQKLLDYTIGEWRVNSETGKRERQVTYKTVTQSILGTNTISCTDKQIIEVEKPHSMYVVNTEVYNEGMRYTDAFYVATRFCMFQQDAQHSSLRISAEVRYVKNVNAIAKAFIEKNCNANLEDGINNQIRRLENSQAIKGNRKSIKNQSSTSKQRLRNKKADGTIPDEEKDVSTSNTVNSFENQTSIKEKTITGKGFFFDLGLFIGIVLLFLHIYLCYKLYSVDQALQSLDSTCFNQCQQACLKNKIHQ